MANRWFSNSQYAIEKNVVFLMAIVTATGSNNAQTLTRARGIQSVTQSATGKWTVVFGDSTGALDPYNALLEFSIGFKSKDGATAPACSNYFLLSEQVNSQSNPSLVLQLTNNAGTATAPAATDVLFLEFALSNSTAV